METEFDGELNNKIVKTGTTTMGVICKDGVVLATESQATAGYFIASKTANKLFKVTNHIGMTISGGVADCQQLIRTLIALSQLQMLEKNKKALRVRSIVQLAAAILFQNRMFPYISMLICGGMDDEGPHLYSLDPFGSILEEKSFTATGSGSIVGIGVLENRYKPEITIDEGIELVKDAISAARKRDTASGGEFQIAVITDKGYKLVT
ncbi:MAG: proteasome subunit beta [Candidatus Helarchaeota archaeon]